MIPDIIDAQPPDSPFHYLKLRREADARERDPMQRAMNDYLSRWNGRFYVSPNRDFETAVECLKREFVLTAKNPMEI